MKKPCFFGKTMIEYRCIDLEMIFILSFQKTFASVRMQREVRCQKKLFLRFGKPRQRQSAL